MNDDQDSRLAALLQADAPPERDALFRLAVLERRERRSFRQRAAMTSALGLAAVVLLALGAQALDENLLGPVSLATVVVGGVAALVLHSGIFLRIIPRR